MSAINMGKKQDTGTAPSGWGCGDCRLRNRCLPSGLNTEQTEALDQVVVHNRSLERHGAVCRSGSAFRFLYAIRSGFVKSTVGQADGRDQVTGVYMAGDLIGMDGIGSGNYVCDLVALEDSNICAIPFADLQRLSRDIPPLQRHLHGLLSRELARSYEVMLVLGSMHIEERIALFLLDLSQRYASRGASPTQFNILLTRHEIGSYLGARLETVSRVLSRFQDEGLIHIQHKVVEIKDLERLSRAVTARSEAYRETFRRPLPSANPSAERTQPSYA